ncbi:MAG: hypothetical protein ABI693_06285 [Bryobacteraceae bacterium]
MKLNNIGIALLGLSGLAFAQDGAAPSAAAPNPLKVALRRWYQANHSGVSAPTGSGTALLFDGVSLWASDQSHGRLLRMRPSDGAVLQTLAVGTPGPLATDGINLWVSSGNTLLKLRASDGSTLASLDIPTGAGGLAFDGLNLWVLTGGFSDPAVVRVQATSAKATLRLQLTAGRPAESILFDGTSVWIAQNGLVKIRPTDGVILDTFSGGLEPLGLTFDGANIWAADNAGQVLKVRASDGANLGIFPMTNFSPVDIVFDGTSVWVTSQVGNAVKKLRATDGAELATVTLPNQPTGLLGSGLAFDGANVWVLADNNAFKL